ncbi:MAG: hypothetical protein Q8R17_01265 [bacterium]|nr:hypothetical protein [bacterium]
MKKINENRGLVKAVFLIVIALVVLGYLGYNLRDIANSAAARDNLAYAWGLVVKLWNWIKSILPPQ